jgi:NAD(P)-dependent dehydrogenase (short-subunit alcohol dehydrogenase family)
MKQRFENKHVIVTGGANGIGRCICEAFLLEGATVTVIDIDKQAGELMQNRYEKLKSGNGVFEYPQDERTAVQDLGLAEKIKFLYDDGFEFCFAVAPHFAVKPAE